MKTPAMAQALAMARRGKQVRQRPGRRPRTRRGPPTPSPTRSRRPTRSARPLAAELADLDPATRTLILKMQPQMREELLQGLREEGPEGYRAFIRDYFKRLTQVKGRTALGSTAFVGRLGHSLRLHRSSDVLVSGLPLMLKWLLQTLGVGDEFLVRLDQATLAVQRPGVLYVGLALLVPVAVFIVRRQRRNLSSTPPASARRSGSRGSPSC